jgi:hypothetical protein
VVANERKRRIITLKTGAFFLYGRMKMLVSKPEKNRGPYFLKYALFMLVKSGFVMVFVRL